MTALQRLTMSHSHSMAVWQQAVCIMNKSIVAAVLALAPLLSLANSTELVSNGSFESQVLKDGKWANFASLTGWSSGSLGIELRNNIAGAAQDQKNFVELDTTGNSFMSQNLQGSTAVTGQVALSFYYAARPSTSAATNGLQVSFGGQTISLSPGAGGGSHNWIHYTGVFNLTATTGDTLTFTALGTGDSLGTSVDNVSVTAISAVPEPETAGMLLAGLAMLGVAARRRKLGA
jgi:hypothetical protein